MLLVVGLWVGVRESGVRGFRVVVEGVLRGFEDVMVVVIVSVH